MLKSIFPAWCRLVCYAMLILSVFLPLILLLFRWIDPETQLHGIKATTQSLMIALMLVICFSRAKDIPDEEQPALRKEAFGYGFLFGSLYFFVISLLSIWWESLQNNLQLMGFIYLVINVICLEFFFQKRRIEIKLKRN